MLQLIRIRNDEQSGVLYLAHVDSHKAPRMYTLVGHRNPLHCTEIGKVIMAFLDMDELNEILHDQELHKYTARTIVDKQELKQHLESIRERGFSTEIEELALGRACIAAPVRGRTGKVIEGISILGPLSDINLIEREHELSRIIIEATDRVSMKLGYITV